MSTTERDMVRKLKEEEPVRDRFTSLQPTYEDSFPPEPEDWDDDGG